MLYFCSFPHTRFPFSVLRIAGRYAFVVLSSFHVLMEKGLTLTLPTYMIKPALALNSQLGQVAGGLTRFDF